MALIKNTDAAELIRDAVVLDLGDLGRQAERLRAASEARAQKIIDDARIEVARLTKAHQKAGFDEGREKGVKEGREQGLKEGRAEALKQSAAQFQQIQQAWIAAAGQWEAQRQSLELQAREAVLELALRFAERLIHRVIEVDRTVIVDQLAGALTHVLRPMDVSVRICPDDRASLVEAMPALLAEFPKFKHLELVDDPAIARGGCVVSYGQGQIDATIVTQLQRVVELMLPSDNAAAPEPPADPPTTPERT